METVLAEINGWYTDPHSHADGIVFGLDRDGRSHHGPQINGFAELNPTVRPRAAAGSTPVFLAATASTRPTRANPKIISVMDGASRGRAIGASSINRASARPDGHP